MVLEGTQIGPCPSEQETGPNNLKCSEATEKAALSGPKDPKEKAEIVEVKPEFNDESDVQKRKADGQNEDSNKDFDIKEEKDQHSSSSEDSSIEDDNSDDEKPLSKMQKKKFPYKSMFSKNYSTYSVKEEPIEDFKAVFKEATLEFEKQKYHQQICEDIITNFAKISLKELQEQYMSNLREAASIEIFVCSLCKYQTMKLINLQCHLLAIHDSKLEKKSFKCSKCTYESSFKSYMERHMEKHREKIGKKYKRKKKYNVIESDNLDDPYLSEGSIGTSTTKKKSQKEKYPCPECSYKGRTEDGLRRHMSGHKDRTKCDLCCYKCHDKMEMKKHKDTHFINKYYQCYKCSYKNGNKTTLGRHLFNEHKISNEASKRSKICEICSFACSNVNALKIHYTSHKTVKDLKEEEIFKCPEPGCNHQTKLKNHLKIHMKIHEPPKFVCETCGLASRRKQTYEDHISTHKKASEIQWLQCPTCPYKARIRAHLRTHIRKGLHGEPMKRHIRLKYREGDQPVKKPPVKRVKSVPSGEEGEKPVKPKRKRKPKPKNCVDEAIANYEEFARAGIGMIFV